MMNTYADNSLKNGFRTVFFGDYVPTLSRALQDGQMYYLWVQLVIILECRRFVFAFSVTVCNNLLAVVMVYMPIPIVF